jgi:hypothetical protein
MLPPHLVPDRPADAVDTPAAPPPETGETVRDFETLTLAEALGLLVRRPIPTLMALSAIAFTPRSLPAAHADPTPLVRVQMPVPAALVPEPDLPPPAPVSPDDPDAVLASDIPTGVRRVRLGLRLVGLAIALWGSLSMSIAPERTPTGFIENGFVLLMIGLVVWSVGEVVPFVVRVRRGIPRDVNNVNVEPYRCDDLLLLVVNPVRAAVLVLMVILAGLAFRYSENNFFTTEGVLAWLGSIAAAVWVFAPRGWSPLTLMADVVRAVRRWRPRLTVPALLLTAIVIGGAVLRFIDLDRMLPEMTSDHVEKLLDAEGIVSSGLTNIFFANNGGRDPLHFYFLAALTALPGVEFNFYLLKLGTAIEGTLSILIMYWLGREAVGRRDRALAETVGLVLAALVAVSAWHIFLSRLGLRIVLTPLVTALVLAFMARGLRYNRRWDFIYAGVALGFGLYSYQALRMLPIAVAFMGFVGLIIGGGTWRIRLTFAFNMAVLALVAAVIFVPLFRFSQDYPADFWRRSSGRLFGDELIQTMDENGNLVMRDATLEEQIAAFNQNVANLLYNTQNALLMFHWRGDGTWFHNADRNPAFDWAAGGLLIVGIGAWLARGARRGDAFSWTLIPASLIMMLPSILSLAFPDENPSHTRISGVLPGAFLLAALPLSLIVVELRRLAGRAGMALAVVGCTAVLGVGLLKVQTDYFGEYRALYSQTVLPYSEGGAVVRRFAVDEGNGYGNAFILAYPHWWDHRALGAEAGALRWNNSILATDNIARDLFNALMRSPDDPFRLDPDRALLFILSPDDNAGLTQLSQYFPNHKASLLISYNNRGYMVFEAPPPGINLLNAIFRSAGVL